MKKIFIYGLFIIVITSNVFAQDAHFSQFFMAPHFINPALIGTGSGDWRVMSNWRQQWGNASTAFNTQTIVGDIKLTGKEEGKNTLAVGAACMMDQSMYGAFKSIYASTTLAYHVQLNENSRIGLGMQGTYGSRRIDYSQLTFGEQFSSQGFDVTLPTGENALTNMKPYLSLSAGLLYNYKTENMNIDFGIAGYHVNRPLQTFVNDPNQIIPFRYVSHLNLEYDASDKMVFNVNSIYQQQSEPRYLSLGGALGVDISNGDRTNMLFGGVWYRYNDSLYPYVGLLLGSLQLGITYDITASKQNQQLSIPRSFELSLVFRQAKRIPGSIPCPWK
jgi:type IX secretion system PorP/SprF family membrane protein